MQPNLTNKKRDFVYYKLQSYLTSMLYATISRTCQPHGEKILWKTLN